MFKHTITRTRPSPDVKWPFEMGGTVFIDEKYTDLSPTSTLSANGLTRTMIRQSADSSVFTSIDNDLANSSSDLYWITQHCTDNGIICTSKTEQV